MIEIKIDIDDINYGDVVSKLMPTLKKKLSEGAEDGSTKKLLADILSIAGNLPVSMIDVLPQSIKDEMAVSIINNSKRKLIELAENTADKYEVGVKVCDISAEIK